MRVSVWCTFCCTLMVFASLGAALGQDTNFATGPQYLMTNQGSPWFLHSIATPSLSLSGPALTVGASAATGGLTAGAENQTISAPPTDALPAVNLFPIYYGASAAQEIEVSFGEELTAQRELPASLLDTGVWRVTTAQALRERGYGMTLAEAAAYGKARSGHAPRVYTNADLERLHGGS